MFTRCAYHGKLFVIVAISVLILSSVETAPEHPILFASILVASLSVNRLLWRSTLKTEAAMRKRNPTAHRFERLYQAHNKKAA